MTASTSQSSSGIWPELGGTRRQVAEQMEIEAAYAGYLDRQEADIVAFRRDEDMRLPADLDYRVRRRSFERGEGKADRPSARPRSARRRGSRA